MLKLLVMFLLCGGDLRSSARQRKRSTFTDGIYYSIHYLTGQNWVLSVLHGKFASANQKHYPDLASEESSVWNFCAPFSHVTWWGNLWWHHKTLTAFLS